MSSAPLPSPARPREFFQCDFDIAGAYPAMVPDAEVLKVVTEVVDDLGLGAYEIKLNHRGLLDAMLAIAGELGAESRCIQGTLQAAPAQFCGGHLRVFSSASATQCAAAVKLIPTVAQPMSPPPDQACRPRSSGPSAPPSTSWTRSPGRQCGGR